MNCLNKYLSASFLIIATIFFAAASRTAFAQTVPPLGAAESFAVLGGTAITATGPAVISGNVGVSPGTAVTGFPPAVVQNGAIYTGVGSLAGPAKASALDAYNNLRGLACVSANNLTGKILGQTPGYLALSPGVYCFDTSAQLNATLTLNDGGNPNAVYVFQIVTERARRLRYAAALIGTAILIIAPITHRQPGGVSSLHSKKINKDRF